MLEPLFTLNPHSYATRNALAQAAGADTHFRPGPTLEEVASGNSLGRGESGEGVRQLQQLLNRAGIQPPLEEDGRFGPRTEDALRRFQEAHQLDQDGILDRHALRALMPAPGYDPNDHYERGSGPIAALSPNAPLSGVLKAGDLERDDSIARAVRASAATLTPDTQLSDARVLYPDGSFDHARAVKLGLDAQGRTRALSFRANMAIDSDGANPSFGDPDHQNQTSMKWNGRSSLNANETPYMVLPPALAQASGAKLGDLVRMRYGDKTVYGIYGDVGPHGKLGEASMATARALGINPDPRRGGLDEGSQSVDYTVLPGTGAAVRGAPKSFDQIQALGAAAFADAVRDGVLRQ
jgi:peptidoglycan hydrolase-like protein with peptidoglycan-binding domain